MKPIKTIKQELLNNPQEYSNGIDTMSLFFSNKLKKFCIIFNAKTFTYSTSNGYNNKKIQLISKYCLTDIQDYYY